MAKKRILRAVDSAAVQPTSDLEAFNLYIEDELDQLLDAESDESFGVTDYRAVEKKAKLSTWSAQDFSNIYLRYRPHLERHARRFLNNQTQVDEVVQDAFLYLMVTLPDLDSETGVLRFLKWKVRLICLDVIRASGRAIVNSIEDHDEFMADDPEISAGLEQADDAAIVKLALSKLNPRHREVLIASLYEEKSSEEIAVQVGLSENATRQLIFRARAAFKKALLGDDIDTEGMSVSAILSVAARRAAEEGKKIGAQAMVLALFLALAVGAFVNFGSRNPASQNLADGTSTSSPSPVTVDPTHPSVEPSGDSDSEAATPDSDDSFSNTPAVAVEHEVDADALNTLVATSSADFAIHRATVIETAASGNITVSKFVADAKNGVKISFIFDSTKPDSDAISEITVSGTTDDGGYTAEAFASALEVIENADGSRVLVLSGSLAQVFDATGYQITDSALVGATITLELVREGNRILAISADFIL